MFFMCWKNCQHVFSFLAGVGVAQCHVRILVLLLSGVGSNSHLFTGPRGKVMVAKYSGFVCKLPLCPFARVANSVPETKLQWTYTCCILSSRWMDLATTDSYEEVLYATS